MPKKTYPPRKRSPDSKPKSQSNIYFTKEHQDAIVEYVKSTDNKHRNNLYKTLIGPCINELVDNIVYTYKFNGLPNLETIKDDCKHTLITILGKFDEERGSKAFSYFTVITKNFFIQSIKKNSRVRHEEVNIDLCYLNQDEDSDNKLFPLYAEQDFVEEQEKEEYLDELKTEFKLWEHEFQTVNEKKIFEAFKQIFENSESLDIVNKKAIYIYMRDLTGLDNKEIGAFFKKLKLNFGEFKHLWANQNV